MRRLLLLLLAAAGCTVLVNNELDGKQPPPVGNCGVAADGSPCDTDGDPESHEFCISGSCVPSFCGDGLVDFFNGEECDGTPDCDESCFVIHGECDDSIMCPNDLNPCNGETICAGGMCTPTDWAPDCSPCLGGDGVEGRCIAGECRVGPVAPDAPPACYDLRIRGGAGFCCGFECRLLENCLREGDP